MTYAFGLKEKKATVMTSDFQRQMFWSAPCCLNYVFEKDMSVNQLAVADQPVEIPSHSLQELLL